MIKSFQTLFKGRQSLDLLQTDEDIRQVIKNELLDEFTHPRSRRPLEKKYSLAVNRLEQSELTREERQTLLFIYKEEFIKLSMVNEM